MGYIPINRWLAAGLCALVVLSASAAARADALDELFREDRVLLDVRVENWRPGGNEGQIYPGKFGSNEWADSVDRWGNDARLVIRTIRDLKIEKHILTVGDLGRTLLESPFFHKKRKGNTSFDDSNANEKMRLGIKSGEVTLSQQVLELIKALKKTYGKQFNFRAANRDHSFLREYIGLKLMREMGVAAARAIHVRMSASDGRAEAHLGLNLMTEAVTNKPFLKKHFNKSKVDIFKLNMFGGIQVPADFRYRGENVSDYFPQDKSGYDIKKAKDPAKAQAAMVKLIRVLNGKELPSGKGFASDEYKAQMERIMDVKAVLNWYASIMALSAWDQTATPSNVFFINTNRADPANPYFSVAATDLNHVIGSTPFKKDGRWVNYAKMPIDKAMDYKLGRQVKRPLLDNLLKHPDFKEMYAEAVLKAATKLYHRHTGLLARLVKRPGQGGIGDKLWPAAKMASVFGETLEWDRTPHTFRPFHASHTFKGLFGYEPVIHPHGWERQASLDITTRDYWPRRRNRFIVKEANRLKREAQQQRAMRRPRTQ